MLLRGVGGGKPRTVSVKIIANRATDDVQSQKIMRALRVSDDVQSQKIMRALRVSDDVQSQRMWMAFRVTTEIIFSA